MTVERAKMLLKGEIERKTNLLNRDRDENASEAILNAHRLEISMLEEILEELTDV
ncbi:MAG: hypothetical protein K5777_03335 [Nitrosopumilus sp.]|nr:hypothetical protein [Nitrosopumilus sp.]